MKEAVLYEAKDMRLVDSPMPECGPNDVLVKLRACAICPTDLRKYSLGKKGSPLIHLPMNMGHEWAGDVVEVGSNIGYPEVGMRVRGGGWGGYGEYNAVDTQRWARFGRRVQDVMIQIPEHVSYEEGTFVENLAISMHAVMDQAGGSLGKTIVIIGAGQMGLTQIMIGRLIGATVIVSELQEWRLELAKEHGADYVVDASEEDPVEAVKKITNGRMADGVVITVGVPDAILQGINMLGRNGTAVLFGGAPLDTTVTFSPNLIHYGDRSLVGCSGGPPRGQLAMDLIATGKTSVKRLISHHFTLEDLPEAFAQITEGKLERYIKGMVTYSP
jgi:2-desacetyl-2-hydroxyethyl bacteriochlorophyllide A dehydrogenase